VIPIFAHRLFKDLPIMIFGDGEQTRDFVNVRDIAEANYRSWMQEGLSGAFNVASATSVTINYLANFMCEAIGIKGAIEYAPPRKGDVRDSLADISAASEAFGYKPSVSLKKGYAHILLGHEKTKFQFTNT
jgi:UDP-glucose 4-epimerase